MTTLIEVINHGPIRELRTARPPVNALDTDLCRQLIHAIELAMAEDAHGIVLSGSERIFTGGMDVPHLLSHGDDKHRLLDTGTPSSARCARWPRAVSRWWPRSPATRRPVAACWRCAATTG